LVKVVTEFNRGRGSGGLSTRATDIYYQDAPGSNAPVSWAEGRSDDQSSRENRAASREVSS
jgi:hypothetical protein